MSLFESFLSYYIQKKGDQILTSLKRLAVAIFSIFAVTNTNEQLINRVVSPSVFLGNFLGGEINSSNLLIEKIDDSMKRDINEDLNDIEYAKKISDITKDEAKEFALLSYLTSATDADVTDETSDLYKAAMDTIRDFNFSIELEDDIVALGRAYLIRDVDIIPFSAFKNVLEEEDLYQEMKNFLDSFIAKTNKTEAFKMLALANISEDMLKLKSSLNNGLIKPIDGVVEESHLEELGITPIDFEGLDQELEGELRNLRLYGITDDIMLDYIKKKYNVEDLIDVIDFEVTDEDVQKMKELTGAKWGPNGTEYTNVLKRLNNNVAKKLRLQEDRSRASKKSRSFISLGRKIRNKRKKNDKEKKRKTRKKKESCRS